MTAATAHDRYREKLSTVRRLRKQRYTFAEIGQELGVSRQRAHQLYKAAITDKETK